MQVIPIVVTKFQQISRLVICPVTKNAILIDPGGDFDKIKAVIEKNEVNLNYVVLTHGHLDHVGASAVFKDEFDVSILGPHQEDEFYINSLEMQARMFNFEVPKNFTPKYLKHKDIIKSGTLEFTVLHSPGHTPGHICYYNHKYKSIFVGDVIFKDSIGRTDFVRGCAKTLIKSIHENILTLDDDTIIYPGHGFNTSVGRERIHNPYLH